ncbi:MAG: hypothetical protein ACOVRN_16640 [Flavobacterium sp.]
MNETLTGTAKQEGKSFVFNLKLKTFKTGFKAEEPIIIKLMDYYGIILRYTHPDGLEDTADGSATSELNFTLEDNYPDDWETTANLRVRVMTINDDGTDMDYMIPYFYERLAYYKYEEGTSEKELERYTTEWLKRQNKKSDVQNESVNLKRKDFKPRIIKGDIVLGIKL